jgi:hypothetical protein
LISNMECILAFCLPVSACVDSLLTICGFHLYFPFFMNIIIKNETLNS